MADARRFNVEDRIRELGEDPATAFARAKADGMAGDAPAPTALGGDQAAAAELPAEDQPLSLADKLRSLAVDSSSSSSSAAPTSTVAKDEAPALSPLGAHIDDKRQAPAIAVPKDSGTLGDTVEAMPNMAPVRATAAPLEDVPTFGQTFEAARRMMRSDRSDFDEIKIRDGYAPIVKALGLKDTENPARFYMADPNTIALTGDLGQPSDLATSAQQGQSMPFGPVRLATRDLQEKLIAAEIQKRRRTEPGFLKGVPDTVDGLHSYFLQQEKDKRAGAAAVVGRSRGLSGALTQAAGGAVEAFHDPLNIATLPIGGGGKTLLTTVAREALVQGVLELVQQPQVAANRAELGEKLTLGEAAANVGIAAAGGGILGGALHGLGAAAKATGAPQAIASGTGTMISKVIDAMPKDVRAKWAARVMTANMPASDFFDHLSNREVVEFAHDAHQGKLTPDETAAGNVLERAQDVGETSPYQPGPAGDGAHEFGLAQSIKALEDHQTPNPAELPSGSAGNGTGAATPAAVTERPPADLSPARRPQLTPRRFVIDRPTSVGEFMDKTRHAESGVNDGAKNPHSSAEGRFQITDGTFRSYYKRLYGVDPGEHPARDLKINVDVQEHIMTELTHDNAEALERAGEKVTNGNLYLMHFLGSGDGVRVLKADASTPIERVLSEKVLHANPTLRGKSTSEVAAWAHTKMDAYYPAVSVPARGEAGALDAAAGDTSMTAQLNAEALQLEQTSIGSPTAAAGGIPPMYGRSYGANSILVDADRFQFKSGGDEAGVTDRLKGISQWNPMYAGRIVAWEDHTGNVFVADGHQRVGLAKRLEAQGHPPINVDAITLREADGVSAEDARVYAALKNIAEGTGTAIDAAKVVRDAGAHVLEHLPPKSALVRDGAALARLSDVAFGAVYNDVLPADYAAVIGHLLPDRPEAHEAMVNLLVETDPANRGQAESIVRQGIAAGMHVETQEELFGAREVTSSLFRERAKVLERGLARLRKAKVIFNTAAKEADELERVGSTIAKSQSEKEARANAEAVAIVDRLAFSRGPIADALNDASRKLASGAKLSDVVDGFVKSVRELDLAAVSREAPVDDASRLAPDGAGRGGDPGEEGPQLFAESGDQEQPSLTELEHATERFSNPDGPAVKQQADSLVHDVRAALTRRERIQAATAELEGTGRGEFRTIEPFPDEPGYHRFRYVADDGTAVGGNYTVDGNLIEGFNIGDVHNPVELGRAELRKLFDQLKAEHPEVRYVHAYRKSGARTHAGGGEQEMWLELTDKGAKFRGTEDPRLGDAAADPAPAQSAAAERSMTRLYRGGTAIDEAKSSAIYATPSRSAAESYIDGNNPAHALHVLDGRLNNPAPEQLAMELARKHIGTEFERTPASMFDSAAWGSKKVNALINDLRERGHDGVIFGEHSDQHPNWEKAPTHVFFRGGDLVPAPHEHVPTLDLGEKVDPAIAERTRQELALRANSPLRPQGIDRVAAEDMAGSFRLTADGDEISAEDLLKELDADDAAIKAIKDCL